LENIGDQYILAKFNELQTWFDTLIFTDGETKYNLDEFFALI
jgi:hypothetical protein